MTRVPEGDQVDRWADLAYLFDVPRRPELVDASCEGTDPDSWLPEKNDHETVRVLRRIREGCPALAECRSWSLSQSSWLAGVWGGLTKVERARINAAASRRVAA